ncbi:MAG: Wzz/FepE/Etk N-terminal domain-containing protein, partial [Fidelibacterota bacterium]
MAELLNNPQQNLDFEEEISLKDIYYILRRNFRLIFIASFAVLLITTVFTLLATPVYESSALMMIEEPNKAMSVFDIGLSSDMNLLTNEMEILKSRTMAEEVVQELWNSPHRNNLFLFGTRVYQPEGLRLSIRRLLTFGLWEPDTANLPRYSGEIPDSVLAATVRSLRSNMEVSNQRNTNMLSLTLPASDPDEAALIVNTFVKLYQQRDQAIS